MLHRECLNNSGNWEKLIIAVSDFDLIDSEVNDRVLFVLTEKPIALKDAPRQLVIDLFFCSRE